MCVGGPDELKRLLRETEERADFAPAAAFGPTRRLAARALEWIKDRIAGAPAVSEARR